MSKRKGLSADDKRKKILALYHESQEPFNLKEIESLGSKQGVVQQSIKDVNQSLVDDNLVCTDKIGAANFFWSFPKKAVQDQIIINGQLLAQLAASRDASKRMETDAAEARATRCASGRTEKMDRLRALLTTEKDLDAKIEAYKFNDPEEVRKVSQSAQENKVAANRWTDNLFVIKSFLVKKKGMASKEADKVLKIDSTFDYIS